MGYPGMKLIIERLHRNSIAGTLAWQETEEEGVYQTAFPNYVVRLSERDTIDPDNSGIDYWVSIHNIEGKLIDEVCDIDMREDFSEIGDSAFRMMKELYDHARRSAMGVQDAINEILGRLS